MHGVIETADYLADAESAGLSPEELVAIKNHVAANPMAGDLMVGAGGARKLRFAAKGKGKSGGVRVVTYFGGDDIPVFLLNVFAKGEKANLTQAERNTLKKVLSDLGDAYRTSTRDAARARRKETQT
jgi:hypothetical protein